MVKNIEFIGRAIVMREFLIHMLFLSFIFSINYVVISGESKEDIIVDIDFSIEFIDFPPLKTSFVWFGKRSLMIKARLINKSDFIVYVEKMVPNFNIAFTITDTEGLSAIRYAPEIVEPQVNDDFYKILYPGESYSITIDLLDYIKCSFDRSKKYYISAVYSANLGRYFGKKDNKIFQGIIRSNTLVFER